MSNNRDLLKEAIADAKAVKETAIANAKAALEEAFTPHLKSMLAAKLEEMEKEDMDESNGMDGSGKLDDSNPDGYLAFMDNEGNINVKNIDAVKEAAKKLAQKHFPEDEGEQGKFVNGFMKAWEESGYSDQLEESTEEVDEEFSLDELLAELEQEDKNLDELSEAGKEAEEEDEEEESEEGEEEVDLEDMSEDDLKSFIEDVIKDMVNSGELEAGEEFEAEDEMGDEEMEAEGEPEEIEEGFATADSAAAGWEKTIRPFLEKIAKQGGELGKEAMKKLEDLGRGAGYALRREGFDENNPNDPTVVYWKNANKLEGMEAAKLRQWAQNYANTHQVEPDFVATFLTTAREAGVDTGEFRMEENLLKEINNLKKELHEVNLLNSKLLYTNKIFREKNLTEDKKIKVLKAFDKATSVKESKLIYETLNEGLVSKQKPLVNEVKGSASKVMGTAPVAKQPIVETDPMVERFKQLAGII